MDFNIDEIFEIAEKIERNGARFYRKAAKNVKEFEHKRLFLELAEMEDNHEKTFAIMRSRIRQNASPEVFDPNHEAAIFLQAFADGFVFDLNEDPVDLLKGRESATDILHLAIGLEKDSIVFYLGIEKIMLIDENSGHVRSIIKEEMNHISLLSQKLTDLT